MIKDVMVHLDGTTADEMRLAAVNEIAELFHGHIVGLFLNLLPVLIAPEDGIGGIQAAELLNKAREAGDKVEKKLSESLRRLQKPVELRRFDILNDAAGDVAAREARTADAFVALRPNGASQEAEHLVESVLFGSGRHILLLPTRKSTKAILERILVAWNGSRESARALAEALPYLRKAKEATVVVVDGDSPAELQATLGEDAVNHLRHHGITAVLHHTMLRDNDIGATLIVEAKRLKTDLIVMGGYGHSRLREWLLGGVTYELLHKSPVPLLVAHWIPSRLAALRASQHLLVSPGFGAGKLFSDRPASWCSGGDAGREMHACTRLPRTMTTIRNRCNVPALVLRCFDFQR